MADTAPATDAPQAARPIKPDETQYKADLAKAEKAHQTASKKFQDSKSKFESARGTGGRNSPGNDRFQELVNDQKEIRTKQGSTKAAKAGQQEKLTKADNELKKLINDQKEARARAGYKSVGEIDDKINQMMKEVDSGKMKLVDEKKALAEVSNLRRSRKAFDQNDTIQKNIDQKKAEIADLKKNFDNAEARALSQKYEDNQKELDEIKAGREANKSSLDSLRADKDRLYGEQQEAWLAMKKVKDDYFQARRAHKEHEDKVYQARREAKALADAAYHKERRTKHAEQRLEEASEPAFLDEIRTAQGLIKHFDPSYGAAAGEKGPSEYAASAQRTIDDSGFKGMKVVKKEDEDFFVGGAGKKKKGKKGPAAAEAGKLNMNVGVIEELSKVGVDPPATQADIPGVVEKLKTKLEEWKKNQKEQTEKNIAKAKAEIERLENEEVAAPAEASKGRRQERSKKVAQKNAGTNVDIPAENEQEQERDAVADASKDLKEAKIEDTNGEATA